MLVLDKPPGLAAESGEDEAFSLITWLRDAVQKRSGWVSDLGLDYVAPAHRVEDETSGILVLAKSSKAKNHLHNQFFERQGRGVFLALVHGTPIDSEWSQSIKVAQDRRKVGKFVHSETRGKLSKVDVLVKQHYSSYTLVEITPSPDRRGLVSVAMSCIGHPIVGDAQYGGLPLLLSRLKADYRLKGDATEKPLISRPAIHFLRMALKSPTDGSPIPVEVEPPKDFRVAIKYLEKFAQ